MSEFEYTEQSMRKIKEFDPNFDYTSFMKEVDKKYEERYPNRK